MRAYCRACDDAVDAGGPWPGACGACGAPVEPHPVPDVVQPGLRVLFVGINPGVRTARERRHFANPRNAFWGALRQAGLADVARQEDLLPLGMGITNVVTRATPGSADVTPEDVARGRERLQRLVDAGRPAWLAFVGKEAYRMATGTRAAEHGEAAPLWGARVFVLPSTSPRNAHVGEAEKVEWFRRLRGAVSSGVGDR